MLRSIDIFSAWMVPDLQTGIAHIASGTEHKALLELLNRVFTTRVEVGPPFDDLGDTAQALRFAWVVVTARGTGLRGVTVFGRLRTRGSAVSAPEVISKLAAIILGRLERFAHRRTRRTSRHVPVLGLNAMARWPTPPQGCIATPTRCRFACAASRNAPAGRLRCRVGSPNYAWPLRLYPKQLVAEPRRGSRIHSPSGAAGENRRAAWSRGHADSLGRAGGVLIVLSGHGSRAW